MFAIIVPFPRSTYNELAIALPSQILQEVYPFRKVKSVETGSGLTQRIYLLMEDGKKVVVPCYARTH